MSDNVQDDSRRKNGTKNLKQQITININSDVINFFKDMANSSGIPYQTLINLYLTDCVKQNRKIDLSWI